MNFQFSTVLKVSWISSLKDHAPDTLAGVSARGEISPLVGRVGGEMRRTSMCIRSLKWLPVVVLALLLPGNGYSWDEWEEPSGQPEQMRSRVHYDPKLTDTFFDADEWSYPYWIIEHPDGHFSSTRLGYNDQVKKPPRLKHTAKCYSTSFAVKHVIKFCQARLLDGHTVDLLIHEVNPAYRDSLRVRITNGRFMCQYWIHDDVGVFRWTTTRQELTLDKKVYKKGDVIKGRIDFECAMKVINPKDVERWGRDPSTTIKVFGAFKTIVE
jgi:hypothetical protein